MKFQELVIVLPCHSFDDFPMYYEGEDANDLLAAYSALWHPALIAHVESMPAWRRSDDEHEELSDRLVVVPKVCQDDMPGYWIDEARSQGATVISTSEYSSRDAIVATALGTLDELPPVDDELVADFLALGFCHVMTEVLTIQMRYASLVDESHFKGLVVDAAKAAVQGDLAAARESLGACFDVLAESKNHFYPVDAFLIDLTLTAPTTLGDGLAAELQSGRKVNLLISGEQIERMAEDHPQTLTALKEALASGRADLIGGEWSEDQGLASATPSDVLDGLGRGLQSYERILGTRPWVFGRRTGGLSPALPQLLSRTGFRGALHISLDGSRVPSAYQSKLEWEGSDGTSIDALARAPLDAALPESFLKLPQHLGDSMDSDHVAVLCFAHWPQGCSTWYDDLLRISKFAPVLGKFVTVGEFFEESGIAVEPTKFTADEYRPVALRRLTADDSPQPISQYVKRAEKDVARQGESALDLMTSLLPVSADNQDEGAEGDSTSETDHKLTRIAEGLPRGAGSSDRGYLAVNPYSFARRLIVSTPELEHSPTGPQIESACELDGVRQAIVEVPPMGYAWICGDSRQPWRAPATKPLAEDHLLRNEHFEVRIHPESGAVRSVHNQQHRGNLLSQRLALRLDSQGGEEGSVWRPPNQPPRYSQMVADAVEITEQTAATATITSRGRLLDPEGALLCEFRQSVSVSRGKPVIQFDVELEPAVLPKGNPWESYYGVLFAWPDGEAEVARSLALGIESTSRRRLEAPHYVDVRSGTLGITILPCGLPYHLRIGSHQLDTLLIVSSESKRQFKFAVGMNISYPATTAVDEMASEMVLARTAVAPSPESSWLFHLDAKNVMATHWEAIKSGTAVRGARVRLVETAGRAATLVRIHCFRAPREARKMNFIGEPLAELQTEGDQVMIELSGHEVTDVELIWEI